MQDEEIDKLIKDAANQHHPPYDDTAWGKMEVMLDKHLPQKKDRKKLLLLLLFFFLLGGTVITVMLQPWKSKQEIAENGIKPVFAKQESNTTPSGNTTEVIKGNAITPEINNQQNNNTDGAAADNTISDITIPEQGSKENNTGKTKNSNIYQQKRRTTIQVKTPAVGANTIEDKIAVKKEPAENIASDDTAPAHIEITKTVSQISEEQKKNASANTVVSDKKETAIEKNKDPLSKEKQNRKNKFTDNFALTFSTGADVSYIDINSTGKLKSFYGAGLSYSAGKHLKLSTGLLVTQKVYSATPYQYKFPGGTSYPNLQSINADCNVYEIPLNVYYNFKAVKNHNWFGGLGISSLLMKKETYNYLYKTPAGQTYSYTKTINNENKHYFSVLTLSGGYQYKLNNRLSFMAESYIKLPFGGVGAGKIKLNSTGLLFTAVIKPFAKRKK